MRKTSLLSQSVLCPFFGVLLAKDVDIRIHPHGSQFCVVYSKCTTLWPVPIQKFFVMKMERVHGGGVAKWWGGWHNERLITLRPPLTTTN